MTITPILHASQWGNTNANTQTKKSPDWLAKVENSNDSVKPLWKNPFFITIVSGLCGFVAAPLLLPASSSLLLLLATDLLIGCAIELLWSHIAESHTLA